MSLLVNGRLGNRSVLSQTLREPEGDLLESVLDRVGTVADVSTHVDRVVTSDRSGDGGEGVGSLSPSNKRSCGRQFRPERRSGGSKEKGEEWETHTSEHDSSSLDDVLTLPNHADDRSGRGHPLDELGEEGLLGQVGVVLAEVLCFRRQEETFEGGQLERRRGKERGGRTLSGGGELEGDLS